MKKEKKWYQKISNWIFALIVLILVPILMMNISIMVKANTDKEKVPDVFGFKPFMVLSGSMETSIKQGDLIMTRVVDPTTLKVDDVIAFRDAEETVTTHRIIEIIQKDGVTYFVTKGDNNNSQDQNLVEYEDVEGIYLFRIPAVGKILKSLSEPTTIIIVVFGLTILFGAGFYFSTKKERDKERQEFLEFKKQQAGIKAAEEKQDENKKPDEEKQQDKKKETRRKTTRR